MKDEELFMTVQTPLGGRPPLPLCLTLLSVLGEWREAGMGCS